MLGFQLQTASGPLHAFIPAADDLHRRLELPGSCVAVLTNLGKEDELRKFRTILGTVGLC
jgi:hypothetical protein